MPQVVLGTEALEALAAETRIRLLKGLVGRQQTLAQLSRAVDRDRAVVHRHLQKLLRGGLIEKDDSHSFTYYRLTWSGRAVVSPGENSRIALLLGLTTLGIGVAAWVAIADSSARGFVALGSELPVGYSLLIPFGAAVAAIALGTAIRRLLPPRARMIGPPLLEPA